MIGSVFLIVLKDNNIIAFCTFTKEDCIKDVNYRPFIGYIYIDGKYGFKICDYKENRHGKIEKIYQKKI